MIKITQPTNGIILGDDHIFECIATWKDGTHPNLTNASFWLTIKEELNDNDEEALVSLNSDDNPTQFVVTGAVTGEYEVWIKDTDQAGLSPDTWYFIDIQIELGDGLLHTHLYDRIRFSQQVTKE